MTAMRSESFAVACKLKAICDPSGDQLGPAAKKPDVNCLGFAPSASTMRMEERSALASNAANAMCRPSGDHVAACESASPVPCNQRKLVPSTAITPMPCANEGSSPQMASLAPSGDQLTPHAPTNAFVESCRRPVPSVFITHSSPHAAG